jgi:hypothetical protein
MQALLLGAEMGSQEDTDPEGGLKPPPRKTVRGARGAFLPVQIRIREGHEQNLFDLLKDLPKGTAAGFLRSVLRDALRFGALTRQGFVWQTDQAVHQLQRDLQLAQAQNLRLSQQVEELSANESAARAEHSSRTDETKTPSPAPHGTSRGGRERKLATGFARALQANPEA